MMSDQQLFQITRDVGEIKADVGNIKDRLEKLEVETRINTDTLTQAKGGWKTLMLIAGAASALGAGLTHIAQYMGMFR